MKKQFLIGSVKWIFLLSFAVLAACSDPDVSVVPDVVETDTSEDLTEDFTEGVEEVDLTCGESICAEGEECCGEQCVDLLMNSENCGACGDVCLGVESCVDGACQCGTDECSGHGSELRAGNKLRRN